MKRYLIDTNVLVYAIDEESEHHGASWHYLKKGLDEEYIPYISLQNLFELYAVITDKRKVKNPVSSKEAIDIITSNFMESSGFKVLFPDSHVLKATLDFLQQHGISSVEVFDAALAATVNINDLDGICTYDEKHFQKYGFEVVTPE